MGSVLLSHQSTNSHQNLILNLSVIAVRNLHSHNILSVPKLMKKAD